VGVGPTILDALRAVVGSEHVLVDPELKASYEVDWTGRFSGEAGCVVRPRDTGEVAAVVGVCHASGMPITVQGGNTSLVGGSVPAGGEVVMSLTRLDELGAVDLAAGQVTVGAGVTLAALQDHAAAAGLGFGIDLAARDSATVGGLMATNAGGVRVVRYGSMRAQVVGAEAVLADGTVVSRLAGLPKDGTGYDLVSLLAGSEGTLGIVTNVRVRLVPRTTAHATALLALTDTNAAVDLLPAVRDKLATLSAAELMFADGLALVREHAQLPAPFRDDHAVYLLLECSDRRDPTDELLRALDESASATDGLLDAAVASDATGRRALWAYREKHTESINAEGVPLKLDVAVPLRRLSQLVDRLQPTISAIAPAARLILFGHANEGNVHINLLDTKDDAEAVTDAVLQLVASLEGTISSEHGVGRAKVPWLSLSRSSADIRAMRAIKTALDPRGILNPGVLLPEPE
jgi:FAD/FMN-containing dehydrogenase